MIVAENKLSIPIEVGWFGTGVSTRDSLLFIGLDFLLFYLHLLPVIHSCNETNLSNELFNCELGYTFLLNSSTGLGYNLLTSWYVFLLNSSAWLGYTLLVWWCTSLSESMTWISTVIESSGITFCSARYAISVDTLPQKETFQTGMKVGPVIFFYSSGIITILENTIRIKENVCCFSCLLLTRVIQCLNGNKVVSIR